MPKPPRQSLIWLEQEQCYQLTLSGCLQQAFRPAEESAWLSWVAEQAAFAFEGQAGHLSVIKEAPPRGTGYWYAYRRQARHTHKCYLGPSSKLTFTRLEQVAWELGSPPATLATKFSPPRQPGSLVERFRLLRELDAARSYPLTL